MSEETGLGEPLANPPNANVDSIVFVHGLGGSRRGTWTSKETAEIPKTTFWPEELLPKSCPTARILSFGYNSKFVSFFPNYRSKDPVAKETTIDNYSSSLLQDLFNLREKTNTPKDRPIIFIAHSLGGLVVANAVAGDKGVNEEGKLIADNTFAILFLGTPFEGSKKAEWESLGGRLKKIIPGIKTDDLKDLKERSAKLQSINAALQTRVKERDRTTPLYIACCFEEFPTYVNKVDIGHIVTQESATFQNVDRVLPIPGNHDTMCKFAATYAPGYDRVEGQLVLWIKALESKATADKDQKVIFAFTMCRPNSNLFFQGGIIMTLQNNVIEGVVAAKIEAPQGEGHLEIVGRKNGPVIIFKDLNADDMAKVLPAATMDKPKQTK
ncbi:hypothetical protein SLS60_003726 [Paraconiothyrium brasiliense]|uniref:DUF676 domain-containing protein n=1 Tax=Paraconiothyrium brasiliense TaxID=300254 RepID=A0ABR3RPG3_9PLEO